LFEPPCPPAAGASRPVRARCAQRVYVAGPPARQEGEWVTGARAFERCAREPGQRPGAGARVRGRAASARRREASAARSRQGAGAHRIAGVAVAGPATTQRPATPSGASPRPPR